MKIQDKTEFMLCDLESINLPEDTNNEDEIELDDIYIHQSNGYAIDGGHTLGYTSPEILSEEELITTQSDIYSLGITVIRLLGICVYPPDICHWDKYILNQKYILPYIKAKLEKMQISDQLKTMLLNMIHNNPENRPTADDILQNPIISILSTSNRPQQSLRLLTKTIAECVALKAIQNARKKHCS